MQTLKKPFKNNNLVMKQNVDTTEDEARGLSSASNFMSDMLGTPMYKAS